MGFFDSIDKPESNTGQPTPPSGGGFFASVDKPGAQPKAAPAPTPVKSPYFSTVDQKGNSIGFSDELDASGKPFMAYRNPGDTATTTDKTRVATTFDPRTPAKLDSKTFLTPRAVADRAGLKKELGGAYSDELDHAIALELSGSNDKSNLIIQGGRTDGGQAAQSDVMENRLAKEVASGQTSLFDAQTQLAQSKGIKTPWTGKPKPSFFDNVKNAVGGAINGVKNLFGGNQVKSETESAPQAQPISKGFFDSVDAPKIEPPAGAKPGDVFTGGDGKQYQVQAPSLVDLGKALMESSGSKPVTPLGNSAVPVTTKTTTPQSGGFDFLDYLFNPNGTVDVRPAGTTKEEAKEIGPLQGPRIITGTASIINNAVSDLIKLPVRFLVDAYQTFKGGGDITVPSYLRDPANRLDLPMDEKGVIKVIGQRTLDRQAENDAKSPNTPVMNTIDAFTQEVLPTIFGGLLAGDIVTAGAKEILAKTGYDAETLSTLRKYDINPDELKTLDPLAARQLVSKQAQLRAQAVLQEYVTAHPESAAQIEKGTLPNDLVSKLNSVSQDVKNIGEQYFNAPKGKLNPFGSALRKIADQSVRPVSKLGAESTFKAVANQPSTQPKELYHGANTETAANIKTNGFQPSTDFPGYGMVSSTESPDVARNYAGTDGEVLNISSEAEITKTYPNMDAYENAIEAEPGETAAEKELALNKDVDQVRIINGDGKGDDLLLTKPDKLAIAPPASKTEFPAPINSTKLLAGTVAGNQASKTKFTSPKLEITKDQQPILAKVNAVLNGTSKTEVIAHTPGFVSADGKERALTFNKETADKIQNHGSVVPENLVANANNWDYVIRNVDKNPDKINLIKQIPNSKNFLIIGANRDNGFYTVTHFEYRAKTGNELKNLLQNKGDSLDRSGRTPSIKEIDSLHVNPSNKGQSSLGSFSGVRADNATNIPKETNTVNATETVSKNRRSIFSKITGPKISIEEARKIVYKEIPQKEVGLLFEKDLIDNMATGQYKPPRESLKGVLKPLIKFYEEGGKVGAFDVYEEVGHYIFNNFLTAEERAEAFKLAEKEMGILDRAKLKISGYSKEEMLEEYIVKKWAKAEASGAGYKGVWQKIFDALSKAVKKIIDTYNKVKKAIDDFLPEKGRQGGFAKNPFAEEEAGGVGKNQSPVERKLTELEVERKTMEEALANNPGKELSRYVNPKTGELPEALGTGRSKFGKVGDQLAQELGFRSSEDARLAYQNYKLHAKRLEILKKDIRVIKETLKTARMEDKDAKSLKFFLDKNAKLTEKRVAEIASAKKPADIQKKLNERKVLAEGHLNRVLQALQRVTPAIESQTLGKQAELLQSLQLPLETENPETDVQMDQSFSLKKIIIDTNTPVKYKVGFLDYLRTPDRILKKIGLSSVADHLRRAYESYLAELPLHIEVIDDWASRITEKGGNKRIFRFLDGQTNRDLHAGKEPVEPMTHEEKRVAGEIKVYLKEWAERLGLPEDNQISHYITHIFNLGENEKEFDEDIAKIIKDKQAGSVYDPFLEKRLGKKGYIEDTWKALDAYVKRAVRKANMDPVLERMKANAGRLEDSQASYLKRLGDRINLRPTEIDNLVDNTFKQFFGYRFGQRPVALISRWLRQAVFRSTLGLNVGSAVKNLTQGVNTFAKLGTRWTTKGYIDLLTKAGNKELEEQGILKQDLIQDRQINAVRKGLQKMDSALFFMFETAEKINRGAAYWGAKAKALNSGVSEADAILYAKKMVRDTQFQFGSIDTPVGLNSDLVKLATQFMSYGVKQTEFVAEMAKNKEWAGLMRYILAAFVLTYTIGKVFNIKLTDQVPLYSTITRFGLPPALALPVELIKAIMDTPDQFGKPVPLNKKIQNVAGALPIPGSVQAQKTYKGLNTLYTNKNISKSPGNVVKAATLGSQNLALTPKAQKAADDKGRIQTLYDKLQKLKADGKTDEANAQYDALPDSDKKVYDAIKKISKAKETKAREGNMQVLYDKLQQMKADGDTDGANAIYDKLSPADKHAYDLVKKQNQ